MSTMLSPPQSQTAQTDPVQARLLACQGYIRGAVKRCAHPDGGYRGLDFNDLVQEATIEVWHEIKDYPDAPIGYLWQVAYRAAIHALRRGRSVDRPITQGKADYQVVSLEALLEGSDGDDGRATVEEALARHKRRGELPDPTADVAIARIMFQELGERLTPRQRQVLNLRLQEYSESAVADVLGVSQAQVSRHVMAIRRKARAAWDDGPKRAARIKPTPEEARERRREQRRRKMSRYYARHREQINARRRARRREKKEGKMAAEYTQLKLGL